MILLDEVIGYDDDALVAEVTITEASLFLTPGRRAGPRRDRVHGAGLRRVCRRSRARLRGHRCRIGLLLGTRDYRVLVPWFRCGERLLIAVTMVFRDEPVAAFACSITIDGKIVADAQLKVYYGDDEQLRIAQGIKE